MRTFKAPLEANVSAEDGKPVKFNTTDIYDEHGNTVKPRQIMGSRPWNKIKGWFEQFVPKGGNDNG